MANSTLKISLAKALKVKSRLKGRLCKLTNDLAAYNSTLEEQRDKFNFKGALETRKAIVTALIELKTALYRGNTGIQETLFKLNEKKADIAFYGQLNTMDGKQRHGYQNTDITYIAIIKKTDVDENIKQLESEIDALQDEIDSYNYTTKVEVSQAVLDLAS